MFFFFFLFFFCFCPPSVPLQPAPPTLQYFSLDTHNWIVKEGRRRRHSRNRRCSCLCLCLCSCPCLCCCWNCPQAFSETSKCRMLNGAPQCTQMDRRQVRTSEQPLVHPCTPESVRLSGNLTYLCGECVTLDTVLWAKLIVESVVDVYLMESIAIR